MMHAPSPPRPRRFRLRPWHWCVVALASLTILLLLWFGLAYGGLPRLWSRHEHKKIGHRDAITSYTAQDIPADPINLRIRGSAAQLRCTFAHAGWAGADAVSVQSGLKIAASVVLSRAYPQAPVSSLYFHDRVQSLAFQVDEGKSADRRHHVRFWQIAPDDWAGAASYDRGVGLSLFTLQITHYIGHDVDGERDRIGQIVQAAGGQAIGTMPSRIVPGKWQRNGGGNRYRTDGLIREYRLGQACAQPPSLPNAAS